MSATDTPLPPSLEILYCDHHDWLRGWLRRKLGNAADAADLAHDTFLRLLAREEDLAFDEPRALLTTVAKRLLVDHWRRQEIERAYLEAVAHLPEPQAPSPETRFLIVEALLRIDALLEGLPARTREIFLFAQLDGLTYRQIADRSGVSLVTVKRHMRSAFCACLTQMADDGEAPAPRARQSECRRLSLLLSGGGAARPRLLTSGDLPMPRIDPAILDEAADWLVLLQSGEATERDRVEHLRWRAVSPAHETAWRRAEDLLGTFRQVPARAGRETLARLHGRGRRRALGLLLTLAAPGAWLLWRHTPWQEWTADLYTATGERKTVTLADGTRLTLNTATAVDVVFTAAERRLILVAGEILVATARDPSPAPRPFLVRTGHGQVRPLGTRFNVRRLDENTRVTVFEGAVEVRPDESGELTVVRAGEQTTFDARAAHPVRAADAGAELWTRGMLLARDMPLAELVAELARHHRGVLRCDPAAARLVVSGAFPVADTQASLDLLEKTLPVRIHRATPYWITVQRTER
jgi:transmembrane sensor